MVEDDGLFNDKGFTLSLLLLLTIYNSINKQFGKDKLEVHINYFIVFMLYKSIAVYDKGINVQYIYKPVSTKSYNIFYSKKYKYIDFFFKLNTKIRNKLKNYVDDKNIFLYTDYKNYLDWLTGSVQHIIMGKLITKEQRKTSLDTKRILFLYKLEVVYDLTNILNIYIEFINNMGAENTFILKGASFFFATVHFLSIFIIAVLNETEIAALNEVFLEFSELLLSDAGYIMLVSTIITLIMSIYTDTSTDKTKKITNLIIYIIITVYYIRFFAAFKHIKRIDGLNLDKDTKNQTKYSLYAIYIYSFQPVVLILLDKLGIK